MKPALLLLAFTLASCRAGSPPARFPSRAPPPPPKGEPRSPLVRAAAAIRRRPPAWWLRVALWCLAARDPAGAIRADEWTALRLPDAALVAREGAGALRTLRRRRRAGRVTRLAGVGY